MAVFHTIIAHNDTYDMYICNWLTSSQQHKQDSDI
jgi:hypothetical protein